MGFKQLYQSPQRPAISFEVFPPKNPQGLAQLHACLNDLVALHPAIVTVTYGAMGTTQALTQELVISFSHKHQLPVASHLTCVGASPASIRTYLQPLIRNGITHIVALRGDAPTGETLSVFGEFAYAYELVTFIRQEYPGISMAVAGYPEKHLQASSAEEDLRYLKQKVDAGADAVITQLFYSNKDYYRFRDRCTQLGIKVPIVPGLMPITNLRQITRITAMCGATLPAPLHQALEQAQTDAAAMLNIGVAWAVSQSQDLLRQGVPGIHFYVLNRAEAAKRIIQAIST